MPSLIFRKGLDLKDAVAGALASDYHSALIDRIREADFMYRAGRLTVHLAREFGFCYGVDRAVDYAYQTRLRFPSRPVYLTGEIIHNPHVNQKLRDVGIRFLSDPDEDAGRLGPNDVVILPAFGVTVHELAQLIARAARSSTRPAGPCSTCGRTSSATRRTDSRPIIHGKVYHEETQATASQALKYPDGHYLIILDRAEADAVCGFIRHGGDAPAFLNRFASAASAGFDPMRDLQRIGLANQTTMLMSESLEIGEMFRQAMLDRYGEAELAAHFRAFDTICSATQDRQDAVMSLLSEQHLDVMIVVGGYNSSNTRNLARICAERVKTYHIADASCLESSTRLRHRPDPASAVHSLEELEETGWLPDGNVSIGLTAGASTPNNIVGQVVERLERFAQPA